MEDTALPLKTMEAPSLNKIFIGILVASIVLGGVAGFLLSRSNKSSGSASTPAASTIQAKTASQDNQTFRDFAEGTIQKRPDPKDSSEYVEGTHLLVRDGAVPVALTSSVVDLSQYEGKRVKVFGETQKAIKEGWLMDVGKVEVKK